jgi:hypothetical protein
MIDFKNQEANRRKSLRKRFEKFLVGATKNAVFIQENGVFLLIGKAIGRIFMVSGDSERA